MVFELAVILVLVLANGVFAGAEIAVVGVERARLSQLLDEGGRRARAIQELRSNPERFFATVQIVITVMGATAGAFGGATFAADLEPLLIPLFGGYAGELSVAAVVVVVSYLSLVLGELVPKSLALRSSERYALWVAPGLVWLSKAARPLVWLLTSSSNLVLAAFGDRTTFSESRLSPSELRQLVDEASEVGALDPRVGDIASRAFDFAELSALHVMVPRTRVVGIEKNADTDAVRATVLETAHSRLLIYQGDLDHVVGYVLYKDLLPLAWEQRLIVLEDLIRPPLFVAETTSAPELLSRMRKERTQLAVVLDEQGGTAGIVTFDDLVEELVGEVFGEIHQSEPASIHPEPGGAAIVRGDAAVRDVNRELQLELPEGDGWTTIGGLCMYLAGGVPKPADVLTTEDGTRIEIVEASERAVELVRIQAIEAPSEHVLPSDR